MADFSKENSSEIVGSTSKTGSAIDNGRKKEWGEYILFIKGYVKLDPIEHKPAEKGSIFKTFDNDHWIAQFEGKSSDQMREMITDWENTLVTHYTKANLSTPTELHTSAHDSRRVDYLKKLLGYELRASEDGKTLRMYREDGSGIEFNNGQQREFPNAQQDKIELEQRFQELLKKENFAHVAFSVDQQTGDLVLSDGRHRTIDQNQDGHIDQNEQDKMLALIKEESASHGQETPKERNAKNIGYNTLTQKDATNIPPKQLPLKNPRTTYDDDIKGKADGINNAANQAAHFENLLNNQGQIKPDNTRKPEFLPPMLKKRGDGPQYTP